MSSGPDSYKVFLIHLIVLSLIQVSQQKILYVRTFIVDNHLVNIIR